MIDPKTDQMMNILNVFVITFILSFTSGITGLLPHTSLQLVSFVLVMLEKVAALASLCAILTHV